MVEATLLCHLISGYSCVTVLSSISPFFLFLRCQLFLFLFFIIVQVQLSPFSPTTFKNRNNDNLQDNPELKNHGSWFFKTVGKCEHSSLNGCVCSALLNESAGRKNLWHLPRISHSSTWPKLITVWIKAIPGH